jgi:hypothetical protein
MRDAGTARTWIWAAGALQVAGLAFDGVWHGLLNPGVEPTRFPDMLSHLLTVHVPLYLGVLSVLLTTGWALLERRRHSAIAFAGALLSTAGEAWHAAIHLRLETHGGPLAEGLAVIGLIVVVTAVWTGGRRERRVPAGRETRRAA